MRLSKISTVSILGGVFVGSLLLTQCTVTATVPSIDILCTLNSDCGDTSVYYCNVQTGKCASLNSCTTASDCYQSNPAGPQDCVNNMCESTSP